MAGVVYRKMGWRRSDPGIHEGMTGSLDILNGIIKKQRWKNDGKMRGTAGWVVDTESSNAVPMNLRNTTSDPHSDDVEESIRLPEFCFSPSLPAAHRPLPATNGTAAGYDNLRPITGLASHLCHTK